MRLNRHIISLYEHVANVANISLKFSIMFSFYFTPLATPYLGTRILWGIHNSNCNVVNISLGYKKRNLRLRRGSNGVREDSFFDIAYVTEGPPIVCTKLNTLWIMEIRLISYSCFSILL
jgi:hypothetical protein